jgi:hypothetical protein
MQNQPAVENSKSTEKKKNFWDIFPTVLTVISTLVVSYIGISINKHISAQELDFKIKANETESKFRKIEVLEKLTPSLVTRDSIQNEIAIVNMYILDSALALKYAEIFNTPGTQGAIKLLFKNTLNSHDTSSKRRLEEVLFNNEIEMHAQVSTSSSLLDVVSKRAFNELKTNVGETKYLTSLGLGNNADWSVAFILWCYFYNKDTEAKLADIKANTVNDFLKRLEIKNFLFDYPLKKNYEVKKPKAGDIVFFDFGENQGPQQCGIVYNIDEEFVYTIEGDTNEGNVDGKVKKKVRYLGDVKCYASIQY